MPDLQHVHRPVLQAESGTVRGPQTVNSESPYCDCGADLDHDERCALQRWLAERHNDPVWVAKMKKRVEEAEALAREKGWLTDGKESL